MSSPAAPASASDLPGETPECAFHPAVADAVRGLSIADVAAQTNITAHTLRYYERIGLVAVPRDAAGHRLYGPKQVGRVVFISLLRAAAMPIRDLQRYFALVDAGPGNEAARIDVLAVHRAHIARSIRDLTDALALVDLKIDHYQNESSS